MKREEGEKVEREKTFLKQMREICFPELARDGRIVLDYYIRIMLFLFPLFLASKQILGNLTEKTLLYVLMTCVTAVIFILLVSRGRVLCRVQIVKSELILLMAAILLVLWTAGTVLRGSMEFESAVFLCCLIGTYFLLRFAPGRSAYYLRLLMAAGLVLDAEILAYYFSFTENTDIRLLLAQPEGTASWLLLAACVASGMYCVEEGERASIFCLAAAAISYLVLFFYQDPVAICITAFFLLMLPLILPATAYLVKRVLLLSFVFLILLSNVPLVQYVGIYRGEMRMTLEYSVYLDLFLGIAGIWVLRYWERVPSERDPKKVVMRRFRRCFVYALSVLGMLTAGCLFYGDGGSSFSPVLSGVGAGIRQSLEANQNMIEGVLNDYGIPGGIVWGLVFAMLGMLIAKGWKKAACGLDKVYLMLSALFLFQSFFYGFQPISSPIFVILLVLALPGEDEGKGGTSEAADKAISVTNG